MAKKLTDIEIAKACGWYNPKGMKAAWAKYGKLRQIPEFTTSLDAIVAEIEAMGLGWIVALRGDKTYWASVRSIGARKVNEVTDSTAPLALCAALLEFLKERK